MSIDVSVMCGLAVCNPRMAAQIVGFHSHGLLTEVRHDEITWLPVAKPDKWLCLYCGGKVAHTREKCPSCGAPEK